MYSEVNSCPRMVYERASLVQDMLPNSRLEKDWSPGLTQEEGWRVKAGGQ